jgi:hypothetical protein
MSATFDHERAFELLPWLINGTLSGSERDSVETHVRDCLTCRIALREQQRLLTMIKGQPTVPLSAAHGFEQLQRRLSLESAVSARRPRRFFQLTPTTGLIALAAALGAVAFTLWLDSSGNAGNERGAYTTLGRDAPAGAVRLDIVFADETTENDMRALLNEIGATLVGGPSEIGRYTVRLESSELTEADVAALMQRLKRDTRVRFAGRSLIAEEEAR